MSLNEKLGRCGVYCGQCRSYHGEVPEIAARLKKWIEVDFSYLREAQIDFDFNNLIQGLDYFSGMEECSCRGQESTWCEVRKCPKIQQGDIDNCLICEEFAECAHTDYVRNRYSYLFDHVKKIQDIGLDKFLEEQERKSKEGVRLADIRDY